MKTETNSTKRKRPIKKIILWIVGSLFLILAIVAFFLYKNFNQLLSNALIKSFNSNIASDVYELKFENLSVNVLDGDISVYNVDLQPRVKPLHNYPYINSSFHLKTAKLLLENVQLGTLIKSNILILDKIEIAEPNVELTIANVRPIIFPFKDTTAISGNAEQSKKRSIEKFFLKEFDLVDASFHVVNSARQREFRIQKFNISLSDLMINQAVGIDDVSYKHVELSIGEASGSLQKEAIKYISFKDFKITVDSLQIHQSPDTLISHFANFGIGIKAFDMQTADSIFHLTMQSFDLSYKDKSIKFADVSFKPNVSEAVLQAGFKYQNTQFSGSVGTLNLLGVNFDSLIYAKKLFIDEIVLDKLSASLFKDKTKPMDMSRFPVYLGQTITKIGLPLLIKQVKGTNVNLVNRERNPDGSYATANVNRATLDVKNITNLSPNEKLMLKADAYLENKAHFNLNLNFNYSGPQFSFDGSFGRFNLPDLNPIIKAYTPASINKGTLDAMTFSGTAFNTNASGTMKFLYHDLDVDLKLKDKAEWKSSTLAFAANSILPSANPASATTPPRIVQFRADRDMHKSFVNLVIKALLSGLKETMIMSKENKKAFREEKKKARKERRKNKK